MKLLVLDGNSLLNRAFFGIRVLTTKDGRYTNAIFGFPEYSAQPGSPPTAPTPSPSPGTSARPLSATKPTTVTRPPATACRRNWPSSCRWVKELLDDLGFVQVEPGPGGRPTTSWAHCPPPARARAARRCWRPATATACRLVDDKTTVLLATNRETLVMDPAAIREKYGVEPLQLIEVKSLMGDSSDNIPGVPGIGEKTALALVQKFGSLQGVYEHLNDAAIKPKQRERLAENREQAELSRMLGTIRRDAPIETAPEAYRRRPGDPAAAAKLLGEPGNAQAGRRAGRWTRRPPPPQTPPNCRPWKPRRCPGASPGGCTSPKTPAPAKGEEGGWYAVQGQAVYTLAKADIPALLDSGAEVWAFDAKPLYRLALEAGRRRAEHPFLTASWRLTC